MRLYLKLGSMRFGFELGEKWTRLTTRRRGSYFYLHRFRGGSQHWAFLAGHTTSHNIALLYRTCFSVFVHYLRRTPVKSVFLLHPSNCGQVPETAVWFWAYLQARSSCIFEEVSLSSWGNIRDAPRSSFSRVQSLHRKIVANTEPPLDLYYYQKQNCGGNDSKSRKQEPWKIKIKNIYRVHSIRKHRWFS